MSGMDPFGDGPPDGAPAQIGVVLDIAKAESEPMVQPNGMADDFGREAVVSIQRFHEPVVADRC